MTPKEKAGDLFDKYFNPLRKLTTDLNYQTYLFKEELCKKHAKESALIAVNEIIESSPLDPNDAEEWLQPADWFSEANISAEKYWLKVKQEIEKL